MDLYKQLQTNSDAIGTIGAQRTPMQVATLTNLLKNNQQHPWMHTMVLYPCPNSYAVYVLVDCGEPLTMIRIGTNIAESDGMKADIVELSEETLRGLQPRLRDELSCNLASLAEKSAFVEEDGVPLGHFNRAIYAVRSIERIRTDDLRAQNVARPMPAPKKPARRLTWWPDFSRTSQSA